MYGIVNGKYYHNHTEISEEDFLDATRCDIIDPSGEPLEQYPELTPEERLDSVEQRTDALEANQDDMILIMADLIGGE